MARAGERTVVHVHPGAPAKPSPGAPCNGCGVCCLVEPCPLGMLVSRRRRGACVALRWETARQRYACGMVVDPASVLAGGRFVTWIAPGLARLARRWIAAGRGCDASFEVARADIDQL
jgi:hypothetical protein